MSELITKRLFDEVSIDCDDENYDSDCDDEDFLDGDENDHPGNAHLNIFSSRPPSLRIINFVVADTVTPTGAETQMEGKQ